MRKQTLCILYHEKAVRNTAEYTNFDLEKDHKTRDIPNWRLAKEDEIPEFTHKDLKIAREWRGLPLWKPANECGVQESTADKLIEIANYFNVTTDEVLGYNPQHNIKKTS